MNKVLGLDYTTLGERKLYGFNDGKFFVTAEHPFYKQQILRLTFLLPESIAIVRTDAIVAYVKKENTKENIIGVEFQNLKSLERKQVRHFINKIMVEKV